MELFNDSNSRGTAVQQQHVLDTLFPIVFDIILSNNVLYWYEGAQISQTGKTCYRIWNNNNSNNHKHRLLGQQLLPTLYKMSGRERSSWIGDISQQEECELLIQYLHQSIRTLHTMINMDELHKPSQLAALENIDLLDIRDDSVGLYSLVHPNRITYAKNLAFLAFVQILQYHDFDFDFVIDNFDISIITNIFPNTVYGHDPETFEESIIKLVNEMFPFTNARFIYFCRKYALPREYYDCLGPALLKKTFIMNPLVKYNNNNTSYNVVTNKIDNTTNGTTTTSSSSIQVVAKYKKKKATVYLPIQGCLEEEEIILFPRHHLGLYDFLFDYVTMAQRNRGGGGRHLAQEQHMFHDNNSEATFLRDMYRDVIDAVQDDNHYNNHDAHEIRQRLHQEFQRHLDNHNHKKMMYLVVTAVVLTTAISLWFLYKYYKPTPLMAVLTWPLTYVPLFHLLYLSIIQGKITLSIIGFFLWWLMASCVMHQVHTITNLTV